MNDPRCGHGIRPRPSSATNVAPGSDGMPKVRTLPADRKVSRVSITQKRQQQRRGRVTGESILLDQGPIATRGTVG
jgi:hypothetical protein